MFATLRRQGLRKIARIHTSTIPNTSLLLALPKNGASASLPKNGAIASLPKTVSCVPSSTRLFTIYSQKFSAAEAALQEDAEAAFEAVKEAATQGIPDLLKFQDLLDHKLIDQSVMRAILQDMKFENMTDVQSKTLRATLEGHDVLAQARTGTGKTIAFLLPVLQRIIASNRPVERHRVGQPLDIRSIIISPTRELAQQIAKEAEILTKHCKNIHIHTAVGGTGKSMGLRNMHKIGCNILIATPGRLYDLLTDSASGVNGKNMEVLVLDEADNLLDQGFADALMDIIKLLPSKEYRQTMLFSATVPAKVQTMINAALKPKHKVLKLVPKGEVLTHNKVEQRLITVNGFENLLPTLYEQMLKEIAITVAEKSKPFKAIVFFPTAKYTALAADTFQALRDPETGRSPFNGTTMIEIHSRLSQPQRERAAKKFREGSSAVLFSSDVVARGMDFPDVTHVFQVGSPRSLEQYIHRIGRTGRGNNSGLGYILLADIEKTYALKELRPEIKLIDYNMHSAIADVDMSKESVLPKAAAEALTRVMEASQSIDDDLKRGAYLANLGYYAYLGNKTALVASLNRWTALGWGMAKPPRISTMLIGRLGLRGVPGIESGGEAFPRPGGQRAFNTRSGDGGFKSRDDREGGFRPREGGFAPRGDSRGGEFAARGDREGGEGGFKPRESDDRESGSKPKEGGFVPRNDREGGSKPREGGFVPRGDVDGGFKPKEGGFVPRGDVDGGFKPKEGGFVPRGDRDGGFVPRGDREGGFKPKEGGFVPRGDREGGFAPRGDREGGFRPREGGFAPRGDREGGFKPREGGFAPRGDREGGFRPREGGFAPRGDREGGFKPREGGFAPRGDRGDFKPRGDREGGFKPREGGFAPRGDRDGGFRPRSDRPEFTSRPQRPWEGRGKQSPGKRFN
ncbi:DEAD-domain-containing protein [Terfezia boudieri ATCC MYA-4762]|uniref:ATP-dependent RNA helicase n=1 Tax=Terfezia boudieri ATCC MYA-4762 TaxID=1051890 RepID=A0A3N4LUT1_9PEZI|nr:DEAD-domain-containing protein [Terfezia boudieri ATCC MYA-4762]